ncbi:MAG: DUF3892 domain-containing protein [Kofleriaceae bacterium]|nr:MAG: DUF3892 domain-containing protein [Kofleriaceae bacterium]
MREERCEVTGTVRDPDGDPSSIIDGLVIKHSTDGLVIIDKPTAVRWAQKGLLWCRAPNGRDIVEVEAYDSDRDGIPDYVRTKPDHTRANNLLRLDIWDRKRKIWLDWQGHARSAS